MKRIHTYSQHYLRSPRLVAELVGHSNIRKNDTVVDLGAGSGVITSVLARRAKRVVAIELEPTALKKLRENVLQYDNVSIIEGDILLAQLPAEPYKVFSNIPFHISAQVIRRLTGAESIAKSVYVIVQRQFARKLVPSDQNFTGQLGAQIAPWWQSRIRKPLSKTDFTPPPAVDTVLLELKPRETPLLSKSERQRYTAFVEQCYQRQVYFAEQPRMKAGINPERKPSELSPQQWVSLFNLANKHR